MKRLRLQTPQRAKVMQVIRTEATRGTGDPETMDDPVRLVYQYWSLDGMLLAEYDSCFPVSREDEKVPAKEGDK